MYGPPTLCRESVRLKSKTGLSRFPFPKDPISLLIFLLSVSVEVYMVNWWGDGWLWDENPTKVSSPPLEFEFEQLKHWVIVWVKPHPLFTFILDFSSKKVNGNGKTKDPTDTGGCRVSESQLRDLRWRSTQNYLYQWYTRSFKVKIYIWVLFIFEYKCPYEHVFTSIVVVSIIGFTLVWFTGSSLPTYLFYTRSVCYLIISR